MFFCGFARAFRSFSHILHLFYAVKARLWSPLIYNSPKLWWSLVAFEEWSPYTGHFECTTVRAKEIWSPWPGGPLIQVVAMAGFTVIEYLNVHIHHTFVTSCHSKGDIMPLSSVILKCRLGLHERVIKYSKSLSTCTKEQLLSKLYLSKQDSHKMSRCMQIRPELQVEIFFHRKNEEKGQIWLPRREELRDSPGSSLCGGRT